MYGRMLPRARTASRLLELKVRGVHGAVVQGNNKLTTSSGPRTFSLPSVNVLAAAVAQAAATRARRFSNVNAWVVGSAVERHRVRIVDCEDVQSVVTSQTEFDWHRASSIDRIQRWQIIHRREEPGEVVDDVHRPGGRARVV